MEQRHPLDKGKTKKWRKNDLERTKKKNEKLATGQQNMVQKNPINGVNNK